MTYESTVRKHKRGHPTKPSKEVDVRRHKRTIQGSRAASRNGEPTRVKSAKAAASRGSSKERWTHDPGCMPGEQCYYLDAPEEGDLDDASAVIIENEATGGFEVRERTGEFRGSFRTVEEAKKTAERWRTTFVPMQNISAWDKPPYPPDIRIDRDDPWVEGWSERRIVEQAFNKRIRAVIDGRKGWSWKAGTEADMEAAEREIQRLEDMKRLYLSGVGGTRHTLPDGTVEIEYTTGTVKLYSEEKSWDTNPPPKKPKNLKRAISTAMKNSNAVKRWEKPPYPEEVVIHVKKGDWLTSQQLKPHLQRRMNKIDDYLNATYWGDADSEDAWSYNKAFREQDRLRIMSLNAMRVRGKWTQGKTDEGHDFDRFSFEDGDVVVIQDG